MSHLEHRPRDLVHVLLAFVLLIVVLLGVHECIRFYYVAQEWSLIP